MATEHLPGSAVRRAAADRRDAREIPARRAGNQPKYSKSMRLPISSVATAATICGRFPRAVTHAGNDHVENEIGKEWILGKVSEVQEHRQRCQVEQDLQKDVSFDALPGDRPVAAG